MSGTASAGPNRFGPHAPSRVADSVRALCGVGLDWVAQYDDESNQEYMTSAQMDDDDRRRCGSFRISVHADAGAGAPVVDSPSGSSAVEWLKAMVPRD